MRKWNSLLEAFFAMVAEEPSLPMLWSKEGGAWVPLTRAEVCTRVLKLAAALREMGVKTGDRVVLVSENRPEWFISDFAIMAAGAVTVPAYTTYTERDFAHILTNSGAAAVIISTAKLARTVLTACQYAPTVKAAITLDAVARQQSLSCDFKTFDEILAAPPVDEAKVRAWGAHVRREDMACVIYTSGTGGMPKGVRITHGALLANCEGAFDVLAEAESLGERIFLSFLPLSHSYERTAGQFLPVYLQGQIYYCEGLEKLAANMEEVRPQIMVVVPRLFEMLRVRVLRAIEKEGGIKLKLFELALDLGVRRATGEHLNIFERALDRVLDRLVRDKVRARFGGRLVALVSGGAPLSPEVGRFFQGLGLPALQGYGQTEAGPIISCNRLTRAKSHTVGPALKGVTVRIAEDGEILVQGECVMQGYWGDEAATAFAIKDGWLHTGDIGHLDADGHIVITDRKKDIIVNDKGDNVSPARIEGLLTLQPEISQAMVYGDRKPHLVALIVPDSEWKSEWLHAALQKGTNAGDAAYLAAVGEAVTRVNGMLSNMEKLRRFAIADEAFSVENSQMTPTLKIRRHAVIARYGDRLEGLY